jgi:hypothetical protein
VVKVSPAQMQAQFGVIESRLHKIITQMALAVKVRKLRWSSTVLPVSWQHQWFAKMGLL